MKYTINRSPSGAFWALNINGRFVMNFDRKWQAEEYALEAIRGVL